MTSGLFCIQVLDDHAVRLVAGRLIDDSGLFAAFGLPESLSAIPAEGCSSRTAGPRCSSAMWLGRRTHASVTGRIGEAGQPLEAMM